MPEPIFKRGSELSPIVQRQVLGTFLHRFTGDHIPAWARKPMSNGKPYPVQFKDDAEWLEHSLFAVTRSGKLDARVNHCMSSATWPNNPELRGRLS